MPETPIRLEAWGLSLETMIMPDIRRPMFSIKPANDTEEFFAVIERYQERNKPEYWGRSSIEMIHQLNPECIISTTIQQQMIAEQNAIEARRRDLYWLDNAHQQQAALSTEFYDLVAARNLQNLPPLEYPVASAGDTFPSPSPPHAADEI